MSIVDDLFARLKSRVTNNHLPLNNDIVGSGDFAVLLRLLDAGQLDIALDADPVQSGNSIQIKGEAVVFGLKLSDLALNFAQDEAGDLQCGLKAVIPSLAFPDFVAFLAGQGLIPPGKLNGVSQLLNYTFSNVAVDYLPGGKILSLELTESTQQWKILEHAGIILDQFGFRFARQDGADGVLLALTGKMELDGNSIDVAVYLPVDPFTLPDTYILSMGSPLQVTSVLGSIAKFLSPSGIDLSDYFPEELDKLDLQIDSLEIQFNPGNPTGERIGYMMFEISSGKSWGISDTLAIEKPGITLYIDFGYEKRVFAKISGVLELGKNNKIRVFIIIPETGNWSLSLDGQTQVGGMTALGNVLDNGVLNLPTVFSDAKKLGLPYFRLDFDPQAKTLCNIGLYLSVDDYWNLPGGISVGYPRLHLDITFDKNNKSIEGRIDGVMDVEGVAFDVRATRNNQGWLFSGELVDNWVLPVGIAELVVTGASVSYDSDKDSGKIAATTAIGSSSLSLDLNIPGGITIGGTLAEIDIKSLAEELCGGFIDLPPGFPEIVFRNTYVTLAVKKDAGTERYDFSLQTTMDIDKIGAAVTVVYELRKEGPATGFVFGLLAPGKWSPAQIWPDLSGIMKYLVFQQSGLILSSFGQTSYIPADVAIPGVPGVIQKGVTVFTTIGLEGPLFSLIGKLFPDPGGLNLSANINPGNLLATCFVATLGRPAGQGSLSFDALQIVIVPERRNFDFSAGLTFDVSSVSAAPTQLCLAVETSLLLPSPGSPNPSITFSIFMKSVKQDGRQQETTGWQDPFGIRGFAIEGFGLEFALSETVNIDFLGRIEIGEGDERFQLAIGGGLADFEVPNYIEFDLDSEKASGKPVTIADIIKGFTSLDVSRVPVLDEADFRRFDFRLVLEPMQNPLNPAETWPPGVFLDGDVVVYGLEISLKIISNYNKGLAAAGFINEKVDPLGLGMLVIAEAKGSARGPRASIDTTALTGGGNKKLFTMHGFVSLLGLESEQIEAEVGLDGVQFTLDYFFLGSTGQMACRLKSLDDFYASYDVNFNLDVMVGPLTVNGVTIFPSIHIHPDVKADLHFTVTINSADKFKFTVEMIFEYLGMNFNPEFSMAVADLGHLWDLIKQWLENNADEIFKDLLNDVDQFLRVFAGELKGLGKDIAHILHDGFRIMATHEAIEALRTIGYGLEEAQGLLEDVYHDVADVLESVYGYFSRLPKKACSTTAAVTLMAGAGGQGATDVIDMLTWLHKLQADLQQTSQGCFYLSVYYAGNDSINYLLSNDDGVREAVAGQQGIKLMNQLVQAIKDNNISTIEPDVYENALAVIGGKLTAAAKNPAHQDHIDPQAVIKAVLTAKQFVPQYVGLTYDQIMEKLKEQSR